MIRSGTMMSESLCHRCRHVRKITSGTGSLFWLCQLAATDPGYRKYPPQPVVRCVGFEPAVDRPSDSSGDREAAGP